MGGVEVDHFLRGTFEGEDDRVSWEDGEVGVEFLLNISFCGIKFGMADSEIESRGRQREHT